MSTTEATDPAVAADGQHQEGPGPQHPLAVEFSLGEAEALRTWLVKSLVDGATALDEPLVSRALASLAQAVDGARAIVNVRRELEDAGLDVGHLADEQVLELGRRVAYAAATHT